MNEEIEQVAAMRAAFDIIEESYEFMLAYAAQGQRQEQGDSQIQIRQYLKRFREALINLESVGSSGFAEKSSSRPFARRFREDTAVVRSVIEVLLSKSSITSDMVDNTNGLIAVRAFLTDVFFIDQAVLPKR